MLKRFAAFMIVMTMVFAFQSSVWAAAINAEDTMAPQQSEIIALAENPQLATLNEDLQLLSATGFGGMKIEPWFWALSIVIPGLGQFLMGDVVRGLIFFFAPTVIAILSGVLTTMLATSAVSGGGLGALAGTLALIGPILGLLMLGVYIWNVVDAYFMNQASMGMASIDSEKIAAEIQKIAEFAQKNQIIAYNGGAGLQHQLATF